MQQSLAVPQNHLPIYRLEAELLKLPQVDMPVKHDFCPGLYARTMHIPAGTVLTGAVHRQDCFFLLRAGELAVTTDNGVMRVEAGQMLHSKAGTKRAGVAITDCTITTFHANPTNAQDPAELWELFTAPAPQLELQGSEMLEVSP